jgi:hypothetical protein
MGLLYWRFARNVTCLSHGYGRGDLGPGQEELRKRQLINPDA